MRQADRVQKGRFETKGDIAFMGTALTVTGFGCSGCLMVTVIGIPLLIVTLPIAVLGLIALIVVPFLRSNKIACPKCGELNGVLAQVKSFSCRECDSKVIVNKKGEASL